MKYVFIRYHIFHIELKEIFIEFFFVIYCFFGFIFLFLAGFAIDCLSWSSFFCSTVYALQCLDESFISCFFFSRCLSCYLEFTRFVLFVLREMIEELILLSIRQVTFRCKLLRQLSLQPIEIFRIGNIAQLYVSRQCALVDSLLCFEIFFCWAVNHIFLHELVNLLCPWLCVCWI